MNPLFSLLRAARCLLGKNQIDIGEKADVKAKTIHLLEAGNYKLLPREALVLKSYYQNAGIEFTERTERHGPGVRWKLPGKPPGEEEPDYFGSRTFRAARGLADVSQRRLAELADVDPSFIARLEKDRFGSINEDTLAKLVDALKTLGVEIVPETGTEGAGVRWTSSKGPGGIEP